MHKARAFFYVSAGLLCLALAYHLGATSAGAQGGASYTLGGISTSSSSDFTCYVALVGRSVGGAARRRLAPKVCDP